MNDLLPAAVVEKVVIKSYYLLLVVTVHTAIPGLQLHYGLSLWFFYLFT